MKAGLVPGQLRAILGRWETPLGLNKDLLHAILLLLELVVDFVQVFKANTVGDHLHGGDLLVLNHLQERLPV